VSRERLNSSRPWDRIGTGEHSNSQRRMLTVLMGAYGGRVRVTLRRIGGTMAVEIGDRTWWVDLAGYAVEAP
jgi:hypothetical protein